MSGRAPRASGRADSMRGGGRGRGYSSGPGFGGDARGGVHGVDRGSRGDRGGGRGTRGGSFQPRGYGGSRGGKLGDDQYTPGPIIYRSVHSSSVTHHLAEELIYFFSGGGDSLPDTQVSAKEDEVVDSHKELNLSTLSLAEYQLPLRPGYGDSGTKIHLRTNYFNLTIDANKKIFKYTFTVQAERQKRDPETGKKRDPPKLPTARSRKMRQALALLFESQDFQNFNPGVATDYGTIIITSKSLNVGKEGVRKYEVVYQEPEDIQFHENPLVYTFTVSSAGIIPTPELLRYLASSTTDPSDWAGKKDAVQALNIIIARTPNFNNKVWQSGDNKFFEYPASSSAYSDLSGGLIAMRGYYSSVRTSTMRVLLNLNAQTSPFYPAIGLMQLMEQHGREPWQDLERFIFRLRVRTNYLKNKDGTPAIKVKTIVGFSHVFAEVTDPKTKKLKKIGNARGDRGSAEQITFECEEFGIGQMSVAAYYEKSKSPNLLNIGSLNLYRAQHQTQVPK